MDKHRSGIIEAEIGLTLCLDTQNKRESEVVQQSNAVAER
jgi:hypothetical protein